MRKFRETQEDSITSVDPPYRSRRSIDTSASYFSGKQTQHVHTQSKTGMVAYLGGVHTLRVDTHIILLYVTNMTSNNTYTKRPRSFQE